MKRSFWLVGLLGSLLVVGLAGSAWAGSSFDEGFYVADGGPQWVVRATGQFVGSPDLDVVVQDTTTGRVGIWEMNGQVFAGGSFVATPPSKDWVVKAVGEFTGDLFTDLVMQDVVSGQVAIWQLTGPVLTNGFLVANPGPDWILIGVGDFGGVAPCVDLVFQHRVSGEVGIWLMDGTTLDAAVSVAGAGVDWALRAVGFFGGNSDLVMQNVTTGQVAVWQMSGSTLTGGFFVATPGPDWVVKAVGEFTGDMDTDIVVQNVVTGEVAIWQMTGPVFTAGGFMIANPGPGWMVTGAGEFTGDLFTDLMLQDISGASGQVGIWGLAVTGSITIVKDAIPNRPQDFSFTHDIGAGGSFDLDDDPTNAVLLNTKIFTNVMAGIYTVTETVPDGWELTSATCSDGSPVTAIELFPGENVTCTFTDTLEPITVLGPFSTGGGSEGDALVTELAAFTTATGIQVIYEQYPDLASLPAWVTGSDPPDLIISPLPGTLGTLAPSLVDLTGFVDLPQLRSDFGDHLIDQVTFDGAVLGGPMKIDLKSLVWYKPAAFEAAGYAIPQSFAELVALSDTMVADGSVPWCNYIGAGLATGFIGTDWVEDLLLGAEGPVVYDQWVDHTVLFQDPRVENAFERYQQIIDTPGYVFDRANMANVSFSDNVIPLEAGDCLMHKQATFFAPLIESLGGDLADYATFKFPSVAPTFDDAMVGGGLYVAAVNDRDAVRELTQFMLGANFGEEALAAFGWLLPNIRFDNSLYPDGLIRSWADLGEAALLADQFRFDASDLMPPPVSTGSFWSGIVDLVVGAKTIPQVLSDIDASWPT